MQEDREAAPALGSLLARGAAAGAGATVAMSVLMLGAGRLGLQGKQPPERIVERALDAAHVRRRERTENELASLAHLGFGAACGALYQLARSRLGLPGPAALHGAAYGLAIWAVSYAGWIPAMRILPKPGHDRRGRVETMVLAHLLYGAVLSALTRPARRDADTP